MDGAERMVWDDGVTICVSDSTSAITITSLPEVEAKAINNSALASTIIKRHPGISFYQGPAV
jgi:hypothetical protein